MAAGVLQPKELQESAARNQETIRGVCANVDKPFISFGRGLGWTTMQGWAYLARFGFIVVGASFAFLWYNAHPAQLFMGGLGSYALGATLGVMALMSGQWLVLPIVIIVPVAEVVSVVLQIGYFKLTRRRTGQPRRLFKMSPLHLHFQLLGWSETQVVQRFWLVGILAAMAGVALALL